MMKNKLILLFLTFSVLCFGQEKIVEITSSQSRISKESIFDFLSKKKVFEMSIEANFDSLFTHKNKIGKYLSGKVSFTNEQDETTTLKIGLKPRGKYRRKICDVPPIRMKFKKKSLKKIGLTGKFNTLKLVTHCRQKDKEAKSNILKEYLTYQIYNLHSKYSLRAQLVKITYIQSTTQKKMFSGYGFFIENEDELAHRVDATIVKQMGIQFDSLVPFENNVHALFQCMIGNSDWSLLNLRNIKLLKLKNNEQLYIFPYDFDFSGLVNAAYAVPNPDFNLESTQDRIFLGKIYSEEEMQKAANHFLNQKEVTLQLCKDFKMLPKWRRKEMTKYLKSFYKLLNRKKPICEKLLKLSPKK